MNKLYYIAALYMCVMFKTFGCGVGERHIFNCESGKKVAQLCLNKEKGMGYFFYEKEALKMKYPESSRSGEFYYSSAMKVGGEEERIRFRVGMYDYYIYQISMNSKDYPYREESGVSVIKSNRKIFNMLCENVDSRFNKSDLELIKTESIKSVPIY